MSLLRRAVQLSPLILPVILDGSDGQQFLIPGSTQVAIAEPGRYYLWNDFQTFYDGKSFNRSQRIPDGLKIMVKDEEGNSLLFNSDKKGERSAGGKALSRAPKRRPWLER
jgi:hypothetical protein